MLEGELIKRQADEELEKERHRELERKQKLKDQADQFKVSNQQLIQAQLEERKKELE